MKTIVTSTALAILALFNIAHAQTDSTQKTKPQFKLSLNYNSNLNYYGRTDSIKSSGFFPMAELWFTPHIYISAAPVFVHNQLSAFDYAGTITTLGYQYTTDKWFTSVYATKPFYKPNTQLVQSALKAQSGITVSYLNNILNLTGGGEVKWSDKTDFGITAGVDHIIRLKNKSNSVFLFDPSIYVYAGTQQFTNTYYKKKGGIILLPGRNVQVSEKVNEFAILAYEVSLPILFVKGPIQLQATPSYIMPKNLITIQGQPNMSEKGTDMLYTTLGIKYSF